MREALINRLVERLSGSEEPLLEVSLSRLYRHFKNTPFAIITAYRSEYSEKENRERNKALASDIKDLGLGYAQTQGVWTNEEGGVDSEPGFTIIGIGFEEAQALADKYDQWSFIWTNGRGAAGEYRSNSGKMVKGSVPWLTFKVFADVKDVGGGTIPKRKKKGRGFTLAASVARLSAEPFLPGYHLRESSVVPHYADQDPKAGFSLKRGRKAPMSVGFGSREYGLTLPLKEMILLEIDLPAGVRARMNLPRVSVGVWEGEDWYWVREDGNVSTIGDIRDRVVRWAKLSG